LFAHYPDAKVILTVRDPEDWYRSAVETIYALAKKYNSFATGSAEGVSTVIWNKTFGGRFEDKDYAIDVFEKHNQSVMDGVPTDRLLVYNVSDGWIPLKSFLRCAEADAVGVFPYTNKRSEFGGIFDMTTAQGD
jgi:hypothetical protein